MLTIQPAVYDRLQTLLVDAIDDSRYYSDSIWFDLDEIEYRFLATMMVDYRHESFPEGDYSTIDNITPIWWEFHSITEYGERLNDFDFDTLKQRICS